MSYIEWVKFVVGSFKWYRDDPYDYCGYIKGEGDNVPYVTIHVCDEDLHVTIHYRTILTFDQWKRANAEFGSLFYSDYEKLRREDPEHIMGWNANKCYIIHGQELNLLPWIYQISQRAD